MDLSAASDDSSPLHRPEGLDTRDVSAAHSTDHRMDHLRRVSLFADCTDVELRRIADISRVVETPAGSVLTKVGTPGDSFFLIIDGRVSMETPVGAGDSLHHAAQSIAAGVAAELLAIDMRAAADALGEITGVITTDEILERIFSEFCIGK